MNWRSSLEPSVRAHLGKLLKETGKYRNSYFRAKNPSNAQLWCALADLNMRLTNLEKSLTCKKKVINKIPVKRKRK